MRSHWLLVQSSAALAPEQCNSLWSCARHTPRSSGWVCCAFASSLVARRLGCPLRWSWMDQDLSRAASFGHPFLCSAGWRSGLRVSLVRVLDYYYHQQYDRIQAAAVGTTLAGIKVKVEVFPRWSDAPHKGYRGCVGTMWSSCQPLLGTRRETGPRTYRPLRCQFCQLRVSLGNRSSQTQIQWRATTPSRVEIC